MMKRSYLVAFLLIVVVLLSVSTTLYTNQPKPKFEVGDIVYPTLLVSEGNLADCITGKFLPSDAITARVDGVEITDIAFCDRHIMYRYLYKVKLFASGTTVYAYEKWLYPSRNDAESALPSSNVPEKE
ncbi:MAG: hypothetical protein FI729_02140 [SAR202 cluster bacterium]|nr:hypothetical protein [SAR202 cluster bacterium]|tara:strand:- start:484 stop:867 length:384 start_codon:yes stop_codon:yes gene_type:complete